MRRWQSDYRTRLAGAPGLDAGLLEGTRRPRLRMTERPAFPGWVVTIRGPAAAENCDIIAHSCQPFDAFADVDYREGFRNLRHSSTTIRQALRMVSRVGITLVFCAWAISPAVGQVVRFDTSVGSFDMVLNPTNN